MNPFGMLASQQPGRVMFLKTTQRPLLIAGGSCDAVGPANSQAGCPGSVLVSVRPCVCPSMSPGRAHPARLPPELLSCRDLLGSGCQTSLPMHLPWCQAGFFPLSFPIKHWGTWPWWDIPTHCRHSPGDRGRAGGEGLGDGSTPPPAPLPAQQVPPSATWGWQRDLGTSHLGMALVPSSAASSPPSSLQPAVGVASCRPYQNRSGPEQVWAPTGAPGSAVPMTGGTCCLLAAEGSSATGLGSPLGGCWCPQLRFAGEGLEIFSSLPSPSILLVIN